MRLSNLIPILLFKLSSILHVHSWYSDLSLRLWSPWSLNVLTISFAFLWVRGPAHYENTQCYFSVNLTRTAVCICKFNILQQYVPRNTVVKFYSTASYYCFEKFRIKWYHWITTVLEVVFTFQPVSFGRWTLSVSLCRETATVFGAVRTCFDHVLSKFSGFSWERILHVSTWWCKFKSKLEILEEFFISIRLGVLTIFKKLHFVWDSEDTFYGLRFTLRKRWRRICTVDWRSHSRHLPRFACLLALFTLARTASRFDYSIWATPK